MQELRRKTGSWLCLAFQMLRWTPFINNSILVTLDILMNIILVGGTPPRLPGPLLILFVTNRSRAKLKSNQKIILDPFDRVHCSNFSKRVHILPVAPVGGKPDSLFELVHSLPADNYYCTISGPGSIIPYNTLPSQPPFT